MPLWVFPVRLVTYRIPIRTFIPSPRQSTTSFARPPFRRGYSASPQRDVAADQPSDEQALENRVTDELVANSATPLRSVDGVSAHDTPVGLTTEPPCAPTPGSAAQGRRHTSGDYAGLQKAIQVDFATLSLQVQDSLLSTTWARNFALVTRRQDTAEAQDERSKSVPILHVWTAKWVEAIIAAMRDGEGSLDMGTLASRFEVDAELIWLHACLWFLTYDPGSAIDFLLVSYKEPYPRVSFVLDSLWYLTRYHLYASDADPSIVPDKIAEAFCVLAECETPERFDDHAGFTQFLIKHCSQEVVQRIYRTILEQDVKVHYHTCLHFTTYFAKIDHFERALDALKRAEKLGAKVNDYPFLSNCATVLRRSMSQPDGLRVCMRLVNYLVDLGVKLNAPIRDIIMLNAVDAGDTRTAFSVHQSLMSEGLAPTETTFHILLRACQLDIDDAETLNQTIRSAIEHVNVRQSSLVADTILQTLALHHAKHHPMTAYRTLVDAYSEIYDPQPLHDLGLPGFTPTKPQNTQHSLIPPTRYSIWTMTRAFASHIILNNRDPREMHAIYTHWRQRVEAADPLYAPLADSDTMANAFLIAFISKKGGLLHAAQVMRDMQRPLDPGVGVQQARPTVKTWTIFLHGFTRHGQNQLAEQVLAYMRRNGIEPNLVTWNTLVHGYARAQDVEGVRDTLLRLEAGGEAWDEWTAGGVRALRDQQRLQAELSRARFERNMDFSGELKRDLGKRLEAASDADVSYAPIDGGEAKKGVSTSSDGVSRPEGSYVPLRRDSRSEGTAKGKSRRDFDPSPSDVDDRSE